MSDTFDNTIKAVQNKLATVGAPNVILNESLLAIVAEVTDYSKKSLDNRRDFIGSLLEAKSLNSVFQIQSEYAKTVFGRSLAEAMKIGALYSNVAKAALRPIEGAMLKPKE
ncbi:phasin family protein [Methylocella silvestris]|uniref:Phasin n=1 Tax=Methylocella silvestris TaxID=199596 RepID=A0A2J7TFS0_METSI|nr:phasin family protein [Methylocella silvestris]PNG25617.1 Phasin [Methylocella silvestris]